MNPGQRNFYAAKEIFNSVPIPEPHPYDTPTRTYSGERGDWLRIASWARQLGYGLLAFNDERLDHLVGALQSIADKISTRFAGSGRGYDTHDRVILIFSGYQTTVVEAGIRHVSGLYLEQSKQPVSDVKNSTLNTG